MKSLFEELGSTYTLGKDGMYYPNLAIEKTDQRSIGKWGRKLIIAPLGNGDGCTGNT